MVLLTHRAGCSTLLEGASQNCLYVLPVQHVRSGVWYPVLQPCSAWGCVARNAPSSWPLLRVPGTVFLQLLEMLLRSFSGTLFVFVSLWFATAWGGRVGL